MIRSGARRMLVLVAALAALVTVAAVLGMAAGAGAARSASLGCYVVGSLTGFVGFALGSTGSFRSRRSDDEGTLAADDRRELRAVAAVLMIVGVALVLLGAAIDPHAQLV